MTMDTGTGVDALVMEVRRLEEDPHVRKLVEERVSDFNELNKGDSSAWFLELVYCLLTAYSSAQRAQLCVDALDDCGAIIHGSTEEVADTLRREGHRFAEKRAEYIVSVRKLAGNIKQIIQRFRSSMKAREWLVMNVKGIGWKESSHFLRNVGYFDVAILDRHILSNMKEHGLIPDTSRGGLTKRRYLEYERILGKVADRLGMPLGQMDLYLWYRKTGKVLK